MQGLKIQYIHLIHLYERSVCYDFVLPVRRMPQPAGSIAKYYIAWRNAFTQYN